MSDKDDCISRQAAIDAINKAFERVFAWDGTSPLGDKVLENVPSVTPTHKKCHSINPDYAECDQFMRREVARAFRISEESQEEKMSDRAILLGMIEEESDPERKSVLERLLRRMDEREKTGTWKPANIRDKSMMFICSECGKIAYYPQGNRKKQEKPKTCKYEFCPNCGKPMQIY